MKGDVAEQFVLHQSCLMRPTDHSPSGTITLIPPDICITQRESTESVHQPSSFSDLHHCLTKWLHGGVGRYLGGPAAKGIDGHDPLVPSTNLARSALPVAPILSPPRTPLRVTEVAIESAPQPRRGRDGASWVFWGKPPSTPRRYRRPIVGTAWLTRLLKVVG
ncbi:hypothetical protein K469DRAFT_704621 [Zopfia rhizophila CBS 207.26]|uniref:Uncharacterized protein n=1 Tax=Zopfia rhizophila CBS 207.26 TaxID=1314779 RepID=A0A6A6E976_9PEZI|nr:hypothetical protein K469DRAFT_704621 [Zopfia rhizophila CBS 207.26]